MTVTVARHYDGERYVVNAPEWLQTKIDAALPYLNPNQPATRLVCPDNPRAELVFGQYAPCNGGYTIDVAR